MGYGRYIESYDKKTEYGTIHLFQFRKFSTKIRHDAVKVFIEHGLEFLLVLIVILEIIYERYNLSIYGGFGIHQVMRGRILFT